MPLNDETPRRAIDPIRRNDPFVCHVDSESLLALCLECSHSTGKLVEQIIGRLDKRAASPTM
jgi:hypothetical protein